MPHKEIKNRDRGAIKGWRIGDVLTNKKTYNLREMIKIFGSAMIAACGMGIHVQEDIPKGGAGEDLDTIAISAGKDLHRITRRAGQDLFYDSFYPGRDLRPFEHQCDTSRAMGSLYRILKGDRPGPLDSTALQFVYSEMPWLNQSEFSALKDALRIMMS